MEHDETRPCDGNRKEEGCGAVSRKSNRKNANRVGVISFRGESAMQREARGIGEEGGKGKKGWSE